MNIIFIGKRGRQTRTMKLASPSGLFTVFIALTILPAVLFYGGYIVAQKVSPGQDKALITAWQGEMDVQRSEIASTRRKVDEDMDALTPFLIPAVN